MDIWEVDYFLASDLLETIRYDHTNVYHDKYTLANDINQALVLNLGLMRSTKLKVFLDESPIIKIQNELSKMYPNDIVLIDDAKLKEICDWLDDDGLVAEDE